jgi:multicomponent Na+:H+ antiporter subunit C
MNTATLFGLCGAALVGLGLYGALTDPQPLRKLLAFNAIARRGAAETVGGDPVPQAIVITGIVVAFAATALAVALLLRLHAASGVASLDRPASDREPAP